MVDFVTKIEEESHGYKLATLGDLGRFMNYAAEPIEVGGVVLESWQPANDEAKRVMVLRAYKDGTLIKQAESQMYHPNNFGVDVEDAHFFDELTEKVIKELGLEN